MSAAETQTELEALECHFTWDLELSESKLLHLRDAMIDIGTEEWTGWLGHVYNLRGFTQYKLGEAQDALRWFNKATEAFRQSRRAATEESPWLVVNYGNLAWLHHHLGDEAESLAYLLKVDTLKKEHPPPSQDELHAEVYAEKAWTLMKFGAGKKRQAVDLFQRAIRMQPDVVEWNTSLVFASTTAFKHSSTGVDVDLMEKMRVAMDQDPENLYIAAEYLEHRAKKGENVEDEVRALAREIMKNPIGSYCGLKTLLRIHRNYGSMDEAIDLAEEALGKHPDERYLKRCAALCYKWKIINSGDTRPVIIARAISLQEEVVALYPHSALTNKIGLANIHAKARGGLGTAEEMYQELLQSDLEPSDMQVIYNYYAKYLNFDHWNSDQSVKYHMKAAEIPERSFFRENSINALKKIGDRGRSHMCQEIKEFLENLPELEKE